MPSTEKLIAKLLRQPAELSYADLAKILESLSWIERGNESSHYLWTKPGYRTLTLKVTRGKVGRAVIGDLARRYEKGDL